MDRLVCTLHTDCKAHVGDQKVLERHSVPRPQVHSRLGTAADSFADCAPTSQSACRLRWVGKAARLETEQLRDPANVFGCPLPSCVPSQPREKAAQYDVSTARAFDMSTRTH